MCTQSVGSLSHHVADAAGRLASNTSAVVADSVDEEAIPSAAEVAGIVDAEVVDSVVAAFEDGKNLFTSDPNWGEAVSIDQGREPRWFGYGESKETGSEQILGGAAEVEGGSGWFGIASPDARQEAAAKLRTFGHLDSQGGSSSAGAEAEAGLRARSEPFELFGHALREQDAFAGFRGRAVAEQGCLGVRAGEEAFFGVAAQGKAGDVEQTEDRWWNAAYSADLGVSESLVGQLSITGADVYAGARAGLDARLKASRHDLVYDDAGVLTQSELGVFAGAMAEADGSLGITGASLEGEAYAGARARLQQGFALAYQGTQIVGGFVGAEGWVGVGARLDASIGYDWELDRFHLEGEAGAALGAGGSVGGGIIVGPKELGKMLDFDTSNDGAP